MTICNLFWALNNEFSNNGDRLPVVENAETVEGKYNKQRKSHHVDINQTENISYPFSCPENYNPDAYPGRIAEDILCMKRPKFLENMKNPCWKEKDRMRCLPYFQIVGVCRSGVADLYNRMLMHPKIVGNTGPHSRETDFWSWKRYGLSFFDIRLINYGDFYTLSDFSNFFEQIQRRSKEENKYDLITGHADSMDFWQAFDWRKIPQNNPKSTAPTYTTPDLIKHINTNIKIILMIRDPVERLYSQYIHDKRFIIRELEPDRNIPDDLYVRRVSEQKLPLVAGLYNEFLKNWLKVFKKEQFLIINFEDYIKDTGGVMAKVFAFLDVDSVDESTITKMSCSKKIHVPIFNSKVLPMLDSTKTLLRRFYEKSQVGLQNLLKKYKIEMSIKPIMVNGKAIDCSKHYISNEREL
ncbi:carbohydrate sulfotransferase 15-like isoform X2 [Mytilus galloprovincialis]|uniref:carbohydrate sulfotransferase 15-like isoform X2 n=1 Tax=Mytilus galloprovincialis TaxID=29158 RepID=UPI003F7BA1EE